MKKLFLPLIVLLICVLCNAKNGATITFQTKMHDFGQVTEKSGTASYDFKFTNTGDSPLVIHKAIASCGCTTPEYPKAPIAPGASASIKVTYNTVGRPGSFNKTITIYCNDTETPNVTLIIKGDVVASNENPEDVYPKNLQGLRLNKSQVSMLELKRGSVRTETVEMINTNERPVEISFYKLPRHIQAMASKSVLKPNEKGSLTIRYTPSLSNDFGRREDSFYIVTNLKDKENPNNRFNVSAYITEDFSRLTPAQRTNAPIASFSENRVNFGAMTRGMHKVTAISLTNKGKSPLYIRKIVPEYDGIKVTPERMTIQPGKSIRITIDFNAGTFDGNIVQRVSFITNDPQNSLTKIYLTAQVTAKK